MFRFLLICLFLAVVFGAVVFPLARSEAQEAKKAAEVRVSLSVPADGGTPRDPKKITRLGAAEFRVVASFEEGGTSVLKHAVSRVDLICRNDGTGPAKVTLHLELSDEGRRTSFDDKPSGGMPLRDFLFVQPPGQEWQQVNGSTAGWVATVSFVALPGETKVGLSPWYTYGDYLKFIRSIPEHPHLVKEKIGQSDAGREHWELRITDPAVAAEKKRTIFWHAREHAYESFSSHAMEGLVEFLLSEAAAGFRARYVIVLHPMTNVDGVAEGFEYRGSYDFPEPRTTATGKLTFGTVDRLRPDFAVAWHNWIAPRDRDVVFYTHTVDGKASRRAWDLFTQWFPSPRANGHQWNDETTPLKYNWHGRSLRESNVHEYSMKRYGTQIWGWEMPWWNRATIDSRKAGAAFAKAFLTTLDDIQGQPAAETPEAAPVTTPRWERHEFVLRGKAHVGNPYREAALVGEFTSPTGKVTVVEGFHDGGDVWRLRFAPSEVGEWSYLLRGEGVELSQRGQLVCTAPKGPGFIGIHPNNPQAFAYADGTPYFPMGDTCYGLFDDSPITPELRAAYLKTRREQRFNFVRMSVGHSPYRAAAEPAKYWAFGGTPERPDLDRYHPEFFRLFDELLDEMRAAGMNAEVLMIDLYRKPFTDPKLWTPERERQWLRYLTARYASFSNVFLWTIANEYETHPDGKYRLDNPDDPNWAKATGRFIKEHDPYRHLVSVHPVVSASTKEPSPRAPFDPPWRIGEFFGNSEGIDVLSQQTGQHGEGTEWDEKLLSWTGDSVTLVDSVRADRRYKKPVLNTENGYEYLKGHPTEKKQVHHTDKVRRSSWRIVCAGGYFAAGFHGTIGHSDVWNKLDPSFHYTFEIRDEGAAGYLAISHDFFTKLPYWRMEPFLGVKGELAVALAEPGKVYVAYLPRGGKLELDMSEVSGEFSAKWFDPRKGTFGEAFSVRGGGVRNVEAPDGLDWALLVSRAN
jgi:hypothetical protein